MGSIGKPKIWTQKFSFLIRLIDALFHPKWNRHDVLVNRISYTGNYTVENRYPLNPIGRTGITGRGLLGRWGPNHAADSLVTRWCRDADDNVKDHPVSKR